MRRLMFLIGIFILVMPAWSQRRANTKDPAPAQGNRIPFEIKELILFEDGKLDEYTTSNWDKDYTHIDNQERHSASGAMLEQVEFAYNVDKGFITTKITRDVESRLRNRVVYQYTNQDALWRESLVDNKGKIVSTYEYGYDSQGNRISRIIKNRAGDKLAETKYTYNAEGKMTESQTSDFSQSTISSTRYTYDAQGNLIGQQVRGPDGKVTSTVRSVWQDGHEIRNEMVGADNKVQRRETNEYGADGELVRRTVENFQGESKQIMQYEYTFRAARRQS